MPSVVMDYGAEGHVTGQGVIDAIIERLRQRLEGDCNLRLSDAYRFYSVHAVIDLHDVDVTRVTADIEGRLAPPVPPVARVEPRQDIPLGSHLERAVDGSAVVPYTVMQPDLAHNVDGSDLLPDPVPEPTTVAAPAPPPPVATGKRVYGGTLPTPPDFNGDTKGVLVDDMPPIPPFRIRSGHPKVHSE